MDTLNKKMVGLGSDSREENVVPLLHLLHLLPTGLYIPPLRSQLVSCSDAPFLPLGDDLRFRCTEKRVIFSIGVAEDSFDWKVT